MGDVFRGRAFAMFWRSPHGGGARAEMRMRNVNRRPTGFLSSDKAARLSKAFELPGDGTFIPAGNTKSSSSTFWPLN